MNEKEAGSGKSGSEPDIEKIYRPEWLELANKLVPEGIRGDTVYDLLKIYQFPYGKSGRYLGVSRSLWESGETCVIIASLKHPNGDIIYEEGDTGEERMAKFMDNLGEFLDNNQMMIVAEFSPDGQLVGIDTCHTIDLPDGGKSMVSEIFAWEDSQWLCAAEPLDFKSQQGLEDAIDHFRILAEIAQKPKVSLPLTRKVDLGLGL